MNVTLTNRVEGLTGIIPFPFEIFFAFNKKAGVKKDWWFTPTGKLKIWFGCLYLQHLGNYTQSDYNALVKEMKYFKTDLLVDENGIYYTIAGDNVARVVNIHWSILNQALEEWNARKDSELWEPLERKH